MRDNNNINNFNGNFNTGTQNIENQNITVADLSKVNTNLIYNDSKVIPANIQEINKMNAKYKIYEIASFISSIVTILTFAFSFFTSFQLIKIIITILWFIICFCFWALFLRYKYFFNNLNEKRYSYSNLYNKLYLKNNHGDIFEVKPPKCPFCKNRKLDMFCSLKPQSIKVDSQYNIEDVFVSILKNEQKQPILFICQRNPNHIIEIDWTQFEIPGD